MATHAVVGAAPARLLAAAFLAAVALRAAVGGPASAPAGLLFAAVLTGLCLLRPAPARALRARSLGWGLAGAAVLLLPVAATHAWGRAGTGGYATWAPVVAAVAVAEEAFLRGTLFDAVAAGHREGGADRQGLAVVVGAALFALLHVPLYGWPIVPLDAAVGLLLGELRRSSGGWAAPALAHTGADLAAWFLR